MKTLPEIMAEAIEKYHRGLMQKRVLKTMEEIEANTDTQKEYLVGSDAVAALNNKLAGLSFYFFTASVSFNNGIATVNIPDGIKTKGYFVSETTGMFESILTATINSTKDQITLRSHNAKTQTPNTNRATVNILILY